MAGSAHGATERMASAAHETVDRLAERGSHAEERSREYYGEIYDYIREHPYTAVGIATAAGFVIGSLLRR